MFGSVWNSAKVLAAAVAILLVGGCGGSSSSSPPPPPPPPPPPTNQAPTADAGADQTVAEGSAVTLDGSGSADSDGTVDVYTWTQTGGTTVTLDLSAPSMPTFTAPQVTANENLTFDLVVTDDDGAVSAADSVVITVTDVPTPPPTANAGPDQTVAEDTPVTLDGSGSTDSDGTVDTYSWTQTTGTVVTLDLTVPSMPTFTAPLVDADEDLTFELVVTDNDGQPSTPDTVVVTVTNVLVAPIADAGPDQVASSLDPVTLDGSGSTDSNGTIETYTWAQTAGPAVTLDETDPVRPTFTAPNVGANQILTFELVVTDNDGVDSAADAVNVTINPTLALPFTDNFGDGNSDGWVTVDDNIENASGWNVAAGRFVQTVDTNTFGKDVDETYRRGTYAYLADSVNLTDYRFEVDITRLTGTSDDIGVMFRYTDNDNYYRFSMNSESGSSRLESKVGGTFVTLASNNRGYDADQFLFDVVIEVEGSLIQVFVNNDPLFAANASDHNTGGVALYGRDGVAFDNVSIATNSTGPSVVVASPVAWTVIPGAPRDVDVTAIARNVPAGGTVEFRVDNVLSSCNAATESIAGVFSAVCPNVAIGNRAIRANLRDNSNAIVDSDNNISVGLATTGVGDKYDAIGDSITLGLMDKYSRDNLSLTDQRTIGFQGWAGVLGDRLTTANGQFNLVGNEGIPGDTSADARFERLNSIIERNPDSNRALVMLGTNDVNAFPAATTPALSCSTRSTRPVTGECKGMHAHSPPSVAESSGDTSRARARSSSKLRACRAARAVATAAPAVRCARSASSKSRSESVPCSRSRRARSISCSAKCSSAAAASSSAAARAIDASAARTSAVASFSLRTSSSAGSGGRYCWTGKTSMTRMLTWSPCGPRWAWCFRSPIPFPNRFTKTLLTDPASTVWPAVKQNWMALLRLRW